MTAIPYAKLKPLLLVLLIVWAMWALLIAAVPLSQQNFPLNDDWVFARSFFLWLETGRIHYLYQPGMPQFGQWLWAAPFAALGGHEHTVLRFSTLLLSWLGLAAFYGILVEHMALPAKRAAMGTAVLAFNPLFFILSGTFMTDVPSLSFSLIALYFYVKGLGSSQLRWFFIAACAAMLAGANRQNTVAVPLAVTIIMLMNPVWRKNVIGLLLVMLPVAVAIGITGWFMQRSDISLYASPDMPSLVKIIIIVFLLAYALGLMSWALCWVKPVRWYYHLMVLIVMAAVASLLSNHGLMFPNTGSLIVAEGVIGSLYKNPPIALWGGAMQYALAALGCIGAALLLPSAFSAMRSSPVALKLLGFYSLINLVLLLLSNAVMDRYSLVFFPWAIAAILHTTRQLKGRRWKIAGMMMAAYAAVSVLFMQDWLARNAALWALAERNVGEGKIAQVDFNGGYEWIGWHTPALAENKRPLPTHQKPTMMTLQEHGMYPDNTARYFIAYSHMPNTTIIDQQHYSRWITGDMQTVYLLTGE